MTGDRLLELFISEMSPKVYHTGGVYVRRDSLDMAVLDYRTPIDNLMEAFVSCCDKLSHKGHVFIIVPEERDNTLENLLLKLTDYAKTANSIKIIAATTYPQTTVVAYRGINDGVVTTVNPQYLPWVCDATMTKPVDGPVDIVYTLADADSDTDNEELRLSLRSVEAFCQDLGNVWVVSEKIPSWLRNTRHIKGCDIYNNCKDANIINKLLTACSDPDVSSRFIFMSDDQLFNAGIPLTRLIPVYNPRGISDFNQTDGNRWTQRMFNTLCCVGGRGGDTQINWDSHCPQPIDKDKFRNIMITTPYNTLPGVCVNTAYFGIKLEPPVIPQTAVKNTFEDKCTGTIALDKPIIGFNDRGFMSGLVDVIRKKHPNKSKYEV